MKRDEPGSDRRKILERYLDRSSPSSERSCVYFREYHGPAPRVRLRKPIVGPPDRPYPELQAVQRLEADGWQAAWIYRGRKFLRTWEPWEETVPPEDVRDLLDRLRQRAGPKGRCWPVVAWRDGDIRFVAMFRQGIEKQLSPAHRRWQEAALAAGVRKDAFQVMGWLGGSFDGVWLKAMNCFGNEVRGWVRYKGQEPFEYGGVNDRSARNVRDWVEGYRGESDLSGGDLLWVVFSDNTAGFTSWDITQERAT